MERSKLPVIRIRDDVDGHHGRTEIGYRHLRVLAQIMAFHDEHLGLRLAITAELAQG